MTIPRNVQPSMFPDVVPDRPVGKIPGSVFVGTNADLIATFAPLYLTGSVLDVTYGNGNWWTTFQPAEFTAHDLYKLDGIDFRHLPEPDRSIDSVCFDPPYIPQGGVETSTLAPNGCGFIDAFGLKSMSREDLYQLMRDGLTEAARVARRYVLAKCNDFVNGGAFHLGHFEMLKHAETIGLTVHDLIVHHTGPGPGGHNIFDVLRARRHHSYLIVFAVNP